MRTTLLFFSIVSILFTSCQQAPKSDGTNQEEAVTKQIDYTNVKEKAFAELFTEIKANEIKESPFDLFPKVNPVVTSGTAESFNSMVVGDGALGNMIGKYTTILGLRGNRYTLEYILKTKTYTLSFFDEQFRNDFIQFGQTSGRNSDKMQQTKLTPVSTPDGNMTYKEARLIIECQLAQTHTVNLDEVYAEDNKKFYDDAFKEVGSYHKIVIGDIKHVWIRQ